MKTVIMAGGKGTRISSVASDIPKPMIKIGDMPVLEHEIMCLRDQGFNDLIITVSHLGHIIMDYFGDGSKISPVTGKPFGVYIEYYEEEQPLGNAGALFKIKDKLTEDFLLLNADAMFDIDFNRFVDHHIKKGGLVTLFTHPNSHPYDSGLILSNMNGEVEQWLSKEDERPKYYCNRVNAGLHILSPKVLECEINTPKVDLDRQLLKPLAGTGQMFVYDSPEYVKDMGTPERYESVNLDYKNKIPWARNLKNKQKCIFLDRDGTINKDRGYVANKKDLVLIDGAAKAIKKINSSEYLCIVVTNQPIIARGGCSVEGLNEIHKHLETLLGREGAYIDGLYYCPHHPDKGYEGEVLEYKIDCDCRKPKIGMVKKASECYNIDLELSYMIGDSWRDIEMGKNANMHTYLVKNEKLDNSSHPVTPDGWADNLLEAINKIIGGKNGF